MERRIKRIRNRRWFVLVAAVVAGLLAAADRLHGQIVGYINMPIDPGYNYLCNPLIRDSNYLSLVVGRPRGCPGLRLAWCEPVVFTAIGIQP